MIQTEKMNSVDGIALVTHELIRSLRNGNLLRQRKNPDRLSAQYTARPGFFASLHLTIFERPANFEFFNQLSPSRVQFSPFFLR